MIPFPPTHESLYATTPTATARATANAKTPASPPFPITTLLLLAEELLAAALAFEVEVPDEPVEVPVAALVLEVTVVWGELPEVVPAVPFEAGAGAGAVVEFPPKDVSCSFSPLYVGKENYHRRRIVGVLRRWQDRLGCSLRLDKQRFGRCR